MATTNKSQEAERSQILQKVRPGQVLTAAMVNEIINLIGRVIQPARNSSIGMRRIGGKYVLFDVGTAAIAASGGVQQWFQVQTVKQDYLECFVYDPVNDTTGTETIAVAKPPLLQASNIDGETLTFADGQTVTYTKDGTNPEYKVSADDGSGGINQFITPNYVTSGQVPIRATNIQTGITDDSGNAIVWQEINDGRTWGSAG